MNIKYKYKIIKENIVLREVYWDVQFTKSEYIQVLFSLIFTKTSIIEKYNDELRFLIREYGNFSNMKKDM
jgi:hypothetical protein